MPKVNKDTLTAAVAALQALKGSDMLSIEGNFKLTAYTMLLERLEQEESQNDSEDS